MVLGAQILGMVNTSLKVYRGCTPVVDTYARKDGSLAVDIIEAVAHAAGVDPNDLPPMFEFINPDAIDDLFLPGGDAMNSPILSFQFEHWNVFVSGDGHIRVCDAAQPTEEPELIFA